MAPAEATAAGHEAGHAAPAAAADGGVESMPRSTSAGIAALAAVTIYLGLFPQVLFDWISKAMLGLAAIWGVH